MLKLGNSLDRNTISTGILKGSHFKKYEVSRGSVSHSANSPGVFADCEPCSRKTANKVNY